MGYWDEGKLYFCGRVNDVIRTGGETVLANEVEKVLLMHPAINDCAVFSLPDEKFGEAVCCAVVTVKTGSVDDLKGWCTQQGLANYKKPQRIFLVSTLPRNASGKVLKHKLQSEFASALRKQRSRL